MKNIIKSLVFCALAASALACNTNPVQKPGFAGAIEYQEKANVDGSTQVDILWVIDNSGSMCQEQEILADNFRLFIDEIEKTSIDFHIGVTTTHMTNKGDDPVSIPGHLQSTPQPIPGSNLSCYYKVSPEGVQDKSDFEPVRKSLAAAVRCMETSDESYNAFSNDDIRCALRIVGRPKNCGIAGRCGPGEVRTKCAASDLFPKQDAYRKIPKVLRAEDYTTNNVLDVTRLKEDFTCMSLVGTKGYWIEKGLSASVEAVKPKLTGGPVDDPNAEGYDKSAPNHGFLRKNSRFALVFVTDENDCSHKGEFSSGASFDENACDVACEYANVAGEEEDSPLIKVQDIKDQLISNLQNSKARKTFGEGEMLVASINGTPKRFSGVKNMCAAGQGDSQKAVCANELGVAYTGDRYIEFLHTFSVGHFYPEKEDNTQGWLCKGDFSPALAAIGKFVGNIGGGCITRSIYPCDTDADCPTFPFTGAAGVCTERKDKNNTVNKYCSSGIQVRVALLDPTPENKEKLKNTGYCEDGSLATTEYPNGCVVAASKYAFNNCPSNLPGIKLEWANETEAKNALAGSSLEVRYNALSSEAEPADEQ